MAEEMMSGSPGNVIPDDPERAREEIRRTRQRMSGTIDEIEGLLVQRKEEVKAQLDVAARFRANPLPALGVVLGAGLLLGLLTGGSDDDDRRERDLEDGDPALGWRDRASTWEARSRRLLRVAREQEDEIADLRAALAVDEWYDDDDFEEVEVYLDEDDEEDGVVRDTISRIIGGLFRRSGRDA
jgi:ElaB/YqjD/DUF883 family membrane-anchored ribosome-binding protein